MFAREEGRADRFRLVGTARKTSFSIALQLSSAPPISTEGALNTSAGFGFLMRSAEAPPTSR
jgi:hypothetical protein